MKQTVCFISPHPDDIELFCGGALLFHYHRGDRMAIMMMTNGEDNHSPHVKRFLKRIGKPHSALPDIRQQEAQERYALLPGIDVIYFKLRDGHLAESDSAFETCKTFLQELHPDIIYLPETSTLSRYRHSDHLHLGQVGTDVQQHYLKQTILRHYHSRKNNFFLDISPDIKEIRSALKYYKSQRMDKYFVEILLHKYYGLQHKGRYAEGYRETLGAGLYHVDERIKKLDTPFCTDTITNEFKSIKLPATYAISSLIAILANISTQEMTDSCGIMVSILAGTGIGLMVKYLLDKQYIFSFRAHGALRTRKALMLYILMGITTTGMFWGVEFGFQFLFETKMMRYFGGVIGLAMGYLIGFGLEKRYVLRLFPALFMKAL